MRIHPERSPDSSVHSNHAPVQSVKIDLGGVTLIAVVILGAILGACGLVMGLNLSRQAQMDMDYKNMKTQQWLLERRLMDREALDLVNGTKLPSDTEYGATGNLKRMKPKGAK